MEDFDIKSCFKINNDGSIKLVKLSLDVKTQICGILGYYHCTLNGKDYYISLESREPYVMFLDVINSNIFAYLERCISESIESPELYLEALSVSPELVYLNKTELKKCCTTIPLLYDIKHKLQLLVDFSYANINHKNEVIFYLITNGFKYSKYKYDPCSSSTGFYYKKIGDNDYLVCICAAGDEKSNIYVYDMFRCTYSKFTLNRNIRPDMRASELILGINISKHKSGLDYLLSNPYATQKEVYNVMNDLML